jgi:outer membrane lipoprotein-sorting protein
MITACAAVLCSSPIPAQVPLPPPNWVLQRARDTYVELKSYADSGTILEEYGTSSKDTHTFATYFIRAPRYFLLKFNKQGGDQYVIWGDPDAFHTWWKSTAQQTDYPNPQNIPAISQSDYNTKGAALKIPTLLYGKSELAARMLAISDPGETGLEDIGGNSCYRLTGRASDTYAATGKEVNVRRLTMWIDVSTYLVRQVREEWDATPGQRHRTTTIYQPQANPSLNDSRFKFVPPAAR